MRRLPLLITLRAEATALTVLAIGQAGLAAGYLGGDGDLLGVHRITGFVIAALTVVLVVTASAYHPRSGLWWPLAAAVVLLIVEAVQITLGFVRIEGVHIFLGVLFTVMATLLTSYLFRPGLSGSSAARA